MVVLYPLMKVVEEVKEEISKEVKEGIPKEVKEEISNIRMALTIRALKVRVVIKERALKEKMVNLTNLGQKEVLFKKEL